jgi:adenosylcobyric acid synthase
VNGAGLMVCGTASDVGKSRIVAGLCRLLSRRGLRVAPFKAQNMSLNSFVTTSGHEIARSQAHQAAAAEVAPEVAMNPVLLKPMGNMRSQLIVMGVAVGEVGAGEHRWGNQGLLETALGALGDLRARFDVVIVEGAGGAAEINLLSSEIANLPLARRAGLPAVLVGDIERGGVFASLFGTVALLPAELASCLAGFVVNKFRGEKSLLESGLSELEERSGLKCLGILPHLGSLLVDSEDSLSLGQEALSGGQSRGDVLDVAVIRLPHLSNFTDFDPFLIEPGVRLRYVADPNGLFGADIVVLPGSKATVSDLAWLCQKGMDQALRRAIEQGCLVLGICAGYQMLGRRILDTVESGAGSVTALCLIDAETEFSPKKITRQRQGVDRDGNALFGYEVRHGSPRSSSFLEPWLTLEEDGVTVPEGVAEGPFFATSLHGLFEADGFRRAFLAEVARRRQKDIVLSERSFDSHRQAEIDLVADALEENLDLPAIEALLARSRT